MATRFEVVAHGPDPAGLRAAAEEAVEEIQRWDRLLSVYRPESEIAQVNALAHRGPVRVSPPVFRLLETARDLHAATDGAFDITVGPLLRCWGLMGEGGRIPTVEALARARARCGMEHVRLDAGQFTVSFDCEGVALDLGAIGKGHAVEQAALLLRDADVASAFVHGGTSTIHALGAPPGCEAWKVTLETPAPAPGGAARRPVAVVPLRDEALSVSAVWGKFFSVAGRTCGHLLDPRTGQPAGRAVMAAVCAPSATQSDALSTALLVLGEEGCARIQTAVPGARTFLTFDDRGVVRFLAHGISLLDPAAMREGA